MELRNGMHRVLWTGRRLGHGQWLSRQEIVETEEEALRLVAEPMKAGFHTVIAQRLEPKRWVKVGGRSRK